MYVIVPNLNCPVDLFAALKNISLSMLLSWVWSVSVGFLSEKVRQFETKEICFHDPITKVFSRFNKLGAFEDDTCHSSSGGKCGIIPDKPEIQMQGCTTLLS
jgi:hypothetical protein